MAVEQTLSEEEDADEASPPSVRLTCGFEERAENSSIFILSILLEIWKK